MAPPLTVPFVSLHVESLTIRVGEAGVELEDEQVLCDVEDGAFRQLQCLESGDLLFSQKFIVFFFATFELTTQQVVRVSVNLSKFFSSPEHVLQCLVIIIDAGIVALLGYAIVFFGLILLMGVVVALGKYFVARDAKAAAAAPAAEVPAAPAAPAEIPAAPGTAGKLKLHNVEPKTAAMLMAIVADTLGKPLNELRFISIKEVK